MMRYDLMTINQYNSNFRRQIFIYNPFIFITHKKKYAQGIVGAKLMLIEWGRGREGKEWVGRGY